MKAICLELAARIRSSMAELDRIAQGALDTWNRGLHEQECPDAYVEATALDLQRYATGLENLCLMVARRLGEAVSACNEGHPRLLEQVARPVDGLRPAVFDPKMLPPMSGRRQFRHVVWDGRMHDVTPEYVGEQAAAVQCLRADLTAHWLAFADFLTAASSQA